MVYIVLKVRWELWYQYVVTVHAGGDSIRWKQLFSHAKRHDVLHTHSEMIQCIIDR